MPLFADLMETRGSFLGAGRDYEAARGVLFGAPMDFTVSFRPGTRLAPQRVREVSQVLEEYSLLLGEELADHPFYDAGDISLPLGNVAASVEAIGRVAAGIAAAGKVPLMIGGEHLVTWPVVDALRSIHPDLVVVQFDGHADLRADYLGERFSHATVMRLVSEALGEGALGEGRLYQFGVRSATADEAAYARRRTRLHPGRVLEPLRAVLPELAGRPLYLTIDIDVVDPAFAPGTGTPEAGGISSSELLEAIWALRGQRVVGFDLVEICPPADPAETTSILGAKALREAILCFC